MLLTSFLLESWAFVFKINLTSMCSLKNVCHSKGLFMLQIWISHSSGSQMCKLEMLFANWKLKSGPISDNRSKLAIVRGIQLLYFKAHTLLAGGGIAKSKSIHPTLSHLLRGCSGLSRCWCIVLTWDQCSDWTLLGTDHSSRPWGATSVITEPTIHIRGSITISSCL